MEWWNGQKEIYLGGSFGHIDRKHSEEFVKKVCVSEIEGPTRKGTPLGRWKVRVKEYMSERGATRGGEGFSNQGGSAWIGRGGGSSDVANPLGDVP